MAKLFESEFQKGVMVAVVKPADPQYQALAPLFIKYGYGFAMPDQKLIFIDGSYVDSIQTIVEAHEVGHIVLGHTGINGPNDEADADGWAIRKLQKHGYIDEANKLIEQYKSRHGFPYVQI
jgi:Zn-dependent peptidase ImmA (M78 family)